MKIIRDTNRTIAQPGKIAGDILKYLGALVIVRVGLAELRKKVLDEYFGSNLTESSAVEHDATRNTTIEAFKAYLKKADRLQRLHHSGFDVKNLSQLAVEYWVIHRSLSRILHLHRPDSTITNLSYAQAFTICDTSAEIKLNRNLLVRDAGLLTVANILIPSTTKATHTTDMKIALGSLVVTRAFLENLVGKVAAEYLNVESANHPSVSKLLSNPEMVKLAYHMYFQKLHRQKALADSGIDAGLISDFHAEYVFIHGRISKLLHLERPGEKVTGEEFCLSYEKSDTSVQIPQSTEQRKRQAALLIAADVCSSDDA